MKKLWSLILIIVTLSFIVYGETLNLKIHGLSVEEVHAAGHCAHCGGTFHRATIYFPKCKNSYRSIVDALKSVNVNSSYGARKTIAYINGIPNYSGTSAQNIKLLNLMKSGRLIKCRGVGTYITCR